MKLNYGHYITIIFIIGAGLILYMVKLSFSIDYQMAEDHYYEKEKLMNELLTAKSNTENIGDLFQYTIQHDQLILTLNDSLDTSSIKGSIHIYCPSDSKYDKKYSLDQQKHHLFNIAELKSGLNIIKCNLESGGKSFYQERVIEITK